MPKGRKPMASAVLDNSTRHLSNKELERRKEVETAFTVLEKLKCPSHLSAIAKKEFKRITNIYKQIPANVINSLDLGSLTTYCEAYAVFMVAQEYWKQNQTLIGEDATAQIRIDRCIRTMEKQSILMSKLAEQLCLTPVGRARMGMIAIKKEESKISKFLNDE